MTKGTNMKLWLKANFKPTAIKALKFIITESIDTDSSAIRDLQKAAKNYKVNIKVITYEGEDAILLSGNAKDAEKLFNEQFSDGKQTLNDAIKEGWVFLK